MELHQHDRKIRLRADALSYPSSHYCLFQIPGVIHINHANPNSCKLHHSCHTVPDEYDLWSFLGDAPPRQDGIWPSMPTCKHCSHFVLIPGKRVPDGTNWFSTGGTTAPDTLFPMTFTSAWVTKGSLLSWLIAEIVCTVLSHLNEWLSRIFFKGFDHYRVQTHQIIHYLCNFKVLSESTIFASQTFPHTSMSLLFASTRHCTIGIQRHLKCLGNCLSKYHTDSLKWSNPICWASPKLTFGYDHHLLMCRLHLQLKTVPSMF